jgi:hypothetical protein
MLDPGNWRQMAVGKLLQRMGLKKSEEHAGCGSRVPNDSGVTSVAIGNPSQISEKSEHREGGLTVVFEYRQRYSIQATGVGWR